VTNIVHEALGGSPFDGREFRWRLGVRSLDPSEWLQIDGQRDRDLAEKKRLLTARFDDVARFAADSPGASIEVLGLAVEQLELHGIRVGPVVDEHPLVAAAQLIQEDLCVMEMTGGRWVLTAGVVCFPTRWDLGEKIGLDLAAIHSPVPGIKSISRNLDRFLERMRPGSLVVRANWSLTRDGALRLEPTGRQAPATTPDDPGADVWLRAERQTLRKLRSGEAICFTIRIHRWPLGDVVDELPASALAAALSTLPEEIAAYKDIEEIRTGLLEWLAGR